MGETLILDTTFLVDYAKAFRYMEKNGRLIGANDLWIAATALAHDMPLVTANHKDFVRVPGLDVRRYWR